MIQPERATCNGLPKWARRMSYRLAQHVTRPGVYPLTLVLADDGTLTLVVVGGQAERIGVKDAAEQGE